MTDNHPITPPPELRRSWFDEAQRKYFDNPSAWVEYIAEKAAQWGADQELGACYEWLVVDRWGTIAGDLRAARRPTPPSLKEQALEELSLISISPESGVRVSALDTIRRALEALDD